MDTIMCVVVSSVFLKNLIAYSKIIHMVKRNIWLSVNLEWYFQTSRHKLEMSAMSRLYGKCIGYRGKRNLKKLTGGSEKQAWTANHKERLSVIITMEDNAKVVAAVVWLFFWRTTNFLISMGWVVDDGDELWGWWRENEFFVFFLLLKICT